MEFLQVLMNLPKQENTSKRIREELDEKFPGIVESVQKINNNGNREFVGGNCQCKHAIL